MRKENNLKNNILLAYPLRKDLKAILKILLKKQRFLMIKKINNKVFSMNHN
jgi:hypothetical protein